MQSQHHCKRPRHQHLLSPYPPTWSLWGLFLTPALQESASYPPVTILTVLTLHLKFQGLTRLLDLLPFTPDEKTRMVLGNPPHQVLQKGLKGWIMEATPICSEFAYALRIHVTSLLPAVVDMSSVMRLRCRLMATMISHLFYFHLVSNQRCCPPMTPYLYLLTLQDNRCLDSTYSSNGPRMDGAWARYQRATPTSNARCLNR